jgi:hypothetical protein
LVSILNAVSSKFYFFGKIAGPARKFLVQGHESKSAKIRYSIWLDGTDENHKQCVRTAVFQDEILTIVSSVLGCVNPNISRAVNAPNKMFFKYYFTT